MKRTLFLLAVTLLSASAVLMNAQAPEASSSGLVCKDSARVCLDYTLNIYLKALLVHKPEALPVADHVKFTENGVEMKLGEGLWKTITGFNVADGGMKQEFLDVPRGAAGTHMVAMEGKSPALFVLRIQVVDRKITEVETMVVRGPQEAILFEPSALHGPSRAMNAIPSKDLLHNREESIRISERYLEGLKSGSFAAADTLFAPDAYRVENGHATGGLTLTDRALPKLTYQIEAVDDDLGLVWIRQDLGPGSGTNAGDSLITWEAVKIYGGQIHAIESFSRVFAKPHTEL